MPPMLSCKTRNSPDFTVIRYKKIRLTMIQQIVVSANNAPNNAAPPATDVGM
jgi:hypothetical protein